MTNTLITLMVEGGLVFMIPLLILSLCSCAVILERIFILGFRVMPSQSVIETIKSSLQKKEYSSLGDALSTEKPLVSFIIRNACTKTLNQENNTTFKQSLELVANNQLDVLNSRFWLLRAIGHIAPLIGLLGTVVGLTISFRNVSIQGLSQQSVAGGIAMALITTVAGLCIAIPTLCAEYCLKAWAQKIYKKITILFSMIV